MAKTTKLRTVELGDLELPDENGKVHKWRQRFFTRSIREEYRALEQELDDEPDMPDSEALARLLAQIDLLIEPPPAPKDGDKGKRPMPSDVLRGLWESETPIEGQPLTLPKLFRLRRDLEAAQNPT